MAATLGTPFGLAFLRLAALRRAILLRARPAVAVLTLGAIASRTLRLAGWGGCGGLDGRVRRLLRRFRGRARFAAAATAAGAAGTLGRAFGAFGAFGMLGGFGARRALRARGGRLSCFRGRRRGGGWIEGRHGGDLSVHRHRAGTPVAVTT